MDPSAQVPRHKPWFPFFKLGLFFIVFVSAMYIIIGAFDPGIERDPKEWEIGPKVNKKVEFFMRFLKPKEKPHGK